MMNKMFFFLLATAISPNVYALKAGDKFIMAMLVQREDSSMEFSAKLGKYDLESTDENYRKERKTEVQIFLKDKNGNVIESSYLKFIDEGGSARVSKVDENKIGKGPWSRTVRRARINFFADPKAHLIEAKFKEKVVASILVSELKTTWVEVEIK